MKPDSRLVTVTMLGFVMACFCEPRGASLGSSCMQPVANSAAFYIASPLRISYVIRSDHYRKGTYSVTNVTSVP